ncbi:MAG TPA: T9SS type A sorting domain-containing protein [Bacteroidia bacterium]|jgi:hypothetical protein|nr:T9SS type A sorting domain-containing protein [Bacteroidia bacterium]
MHPSWRYSNRYIYILPTDLDVNPASSTPVNVSSDLYASNTIILDNTLIPSGSSPSIEASKYIEMKDNSHFQSGHYFIENINCADFHRLANSDGGNSGNQPNSPTKGFVKNSNIVPTPNNQSLSVNGNKNQSSTISIYPNPTNSGITIDFNNSLLSTNNVTYKIYNTTGQNVKSQNPPINSDSQLNIDLSDLNPGLYNIIINQGSKTWQKKVIKQ